MALKKSHSILFSLAISLFFAHLAEAECISNLADLKEKGIATSLVETTADDGKPLYISFMGDDKGLSVKVSKGGQLALSAPAKICLSGKSYTVQLVGALNVGPGLPGPARMFSGQIKNIEIERTGSNYSTSLMGGAWKAKMAEAGR